MAGMILVPLDGSPLAERALPHALSLAEHTAGSLLLLHVVPEPTRTLRGPDGNLLTAVEQLDTFQAGADRYLAQVEQRRSLGAVAIAHRVGVGDAVEKIAEIADEEQVAFLVMSTHGRTGLSRWAMGSVTTQVLHLTQRPTLVLPARAAPPAALHNFKRILVPLDGSSQPEQGLPLVKSLARAYGGELFLFCALPLPPVLVGGPEAIMLETSWYETSREEMHKYLEEQAASLQAEGFIVHCEIGREPVAEAILTLAKKVRADLVAMTTHARRGLSRFLLGSVTERVVQQGEVPILVIHGAPPAPSEVSNEVSGSGTGL